MAQYGSGDQLTRKEESHHHQNDDGLITSATAGHEIGGTGTNIHSTTIGTGADQGYGERKHGGAAGGFLHRSGSGSSSSSEDDGEGGRRKKKGVVEKIKEKLPGGDHGGIDEHKTTSVTAGTIGGGEGHGYGGEEGHEKKGLMEKIKEKLPGGGHE
ncbi:hypothetical protein SSX86_019200 [Deinandra increscens subsp. villosa]|uniref:Dehydrin n=1 Tax=Deinandra increscens subsp. villosa TaxID=3103831 RepID=A0AAP0CTS9_9ASTR